MKEMAKFEASLGQVIEVRAVPKAKQNKIVQEDGRLKVYVTAAPENGKANAAIVKLLAKAFGVAKGRITQLRGAAGRDKLFRID